MKQMDKYKEPSQMAWHLSKLFFLVLKMVNNELISYKKVEK
jgi:hypothetical protein